jgi:hypothetical protein
MRRPELWKVISPLLLAAGGLFGCASDGASATPPGTPGPGSASCPPYTAPALPAAIAPPGAARLYRHLAATGVQIYTCQMAMDGAAGWTLKAPDARLFDEHCALVGTHFAGPTWRLDADGSTVVGKKMSEAPAAGAIPWLLLSAASGSGAGAFAPVTFIQRVDTIGGLAPADGCDPSRVGTEVAVPYTATYLYYRNDGGEAPRPY